MSMPTVTGFYPKPQVVASLPETCLKRLQSSISGGECLVDRHNAFTDYCLALLFCCTGHRAVRDPFSELSHFDVDGGLLLICDKVSDESRAWRMVALPHMAAEQVSLYRQYLRLLASKLKGRSTLSELPAQIWDLFEGSKCMPLFFYLRESGDGWDPVTPAKLTKRWEDRWRLPVNLLRHVMADTLLHLTRRADWVSIQLGHTDGVDHPFGSTSTRPVLDTLGQIRPFLDEGLKMIGWAVAHSPLHGSRVRHRPEKQTLADAPATAAFGHQQREAKRRRKHIIAAEFFRDLWRQEFPTDTAVDRAAVQRLAERIIVQAPARGHSINWCLELLYRYLRFRPGGPAVLRQITRYRQIGIEPSPFCAGSLANYQAVHKFRSAFLDYLEQQGKIQTPFEAHTRLAEVVVSAALFGGVANAHRLRVLGGALLAHSYRLKDAVFVDLPLGQGAVFRWFPDHVSQRLIHGLFRSVAADQRWQNSRVENAVGSLVSEIGGSSNGDPYDWLFQISSAASLMEIPGYISSCINGGIPAVSLPLPQWVRAVTGQSLVSDDELPEEHLAWEDSWSPILEKSKRKHTAGEGRAFLRELGRMFSAARNTERVGNQLARTRSKRELVRNLQRASKDADWSALQMMLAAWTVHLCRHGTRGQRDLAYSTVEKYSVLATSRLLPVSANLDIYILDEQAYEELYLRAVEREQPARRFELASRLREMHAFFQEAYLVEDLDWSSIMGVAGGRAEKRFAEANILTSVEYRRALTALVNEESLGERRRWQYAGLLLLGFRFGLRFGEALRLRFTDVQYNGDQVYVWVHNSVFGETKSHAGVRVVPLIERLDELESQVLDRLLAGGKSDFDDNPAAMLMAERSGSAELMDRAEVGRVLNGLLRRVTGDKSTRFHHLRHGWVTRAVSSHVGLVIPGFCEQLSEAAWPDFYGDDAGFPLRSIVVGAGHSNESTTLGSYTHCIDQLVSDYLPNPRLTDHAVAYAEQVAYATVRTRRRGSGRASHGRLPAIPKPTVATQMPQFVSLSGIIYQSQETRPLSLTDVDMLLRRFRNSGQPIEVVARTLGLNIQASILAVERALDLEIRTGYDGYRLAARSGDPLAEAVSGRKTSQFKLESRAVVERLTRLDSQLAMMQPADVDSVLSGLRAWEATADAKSGACDLVRAEQLNSIASLAWLLDARISVTVPRALDTSELRALLEANGMESSVGRARQTAIRLSLNPVNGARRTLQRQLLVMAVVIPVRFQASSAENFQSGATFSV